MYHMDYVSIFISINNDEKEGEKTVGTGIYVYCIILAHRNILNSS